MFLITPKFDTLLDKLDEHEKSLFNPNPLALPAADVDPKINIKIT